MLLRRCPTTRAPGPSFPSGRSNILAPRHAIPMRAGEQYRKSIGKPRSGTESGVRHDLHDFHFLDGSLPKDTPTMRQWKNARKGLADRVKTMHEEMVALHKKFEDVPMHTTVSSLGSTSEQKEVKRTIATRGQKSVKRNKLRLTQDLPNAPRKPKPLPAGQYQPSAGTEYSRRSRPGFLRHEAKMKGEKRVKPEPLLSRRQQEQAVIEKERLARIAHAAQVARDAKAAIRAAREQ